MFQKMKKSKGFTLIEMLVVIAIIAVLVAIIIPVVGNSTVKASAAANAANLRALKAEAVTAMLTGTSSANVTVTNNNGTITMAPTESAPKAKAIKNYCANTDAAVFTVDATTQNVTVTYNSHTINDFATIAENGTVPG